MVSTDLCSFLLNSTGLLWSLLISVGFCSIGLCWSSLVPAGLHWSPVVRGRSSLVSSGLQWSPVVCAGLCWSPVLSAALASLVSLLLTHYSHVRIDAQLIAFRYAILYM